MRTVGTATAAGLLLVASSGAAQKATPVDGGALVSGVNACRTIADPGARLACYDKAAGALQQAVTQKNIVVLDREAVRSTRRSLFGFNLPKLPFFGGGEDEPEEAREITATIASASALRYDNWIIKLQDGAVWRTTEAFRGFADPAAGMKVLIRRGPLESYMMRVANQRGVRVVRQN